MARKKSPEDLTVEELRRLLVEKRRGARQERLEQYRRTGRVINVAPEVESGDVEAFRSQASPEASQAAPPVSGKKRFLDRFLFVVEIAAVAGLLFVLLNGFNLLRDLNHEVVSALEQPTLTPTPLITAVVLPSGHTPPNAPGGVQPNLDEIPEHLRPLVQTLASLPIPTPSPEQLVRLQIPAIKVDAPVVQGDGWEQLKKGVGQHVGTPNPGQKGNLVLSAHNDVFGEIFRDLDKLKPGDSVTLYTNQRAYTYIVKDSKIVLPTQVEIMAPTDGAVVTLISCYPYMVDNKRIAVTAELQNNP
ncbi:MAG: class D sortase [Chloroflexi bacterium]|nr:class D sortase [Chloroflexota bacterium]